MIWNLSRPKPALPNSYFWTWDHSANWVLDDPGIVNYGCCNSYLKRPETFVQDYRLLTDLAAGLGVKGILIWGFLRDSHGGAEAARQVAHYALSRGVALMPGVGTTWYGGIYYEGNHPYNIETFVGANPDCLMRDEHGRPLREGACPSNPKYLEWLSEAMSWLFREFEIGGANLENGDFVVCRDELCNRHKQNWPADDPEFFRFQAMSYVPALEAVREHLADKLVSAATYTGFLPGTGVQDNMIPHMQCRRPAMIDRIPPEAIVQWTLTGMVRRESLPLADYLDDGAPAAAFDNPNWPADLRAPAARNCGFLHQPSQWSSPGRYEQGVSVIKEACLRAYRSGLEGVSIHGEVTSRCIPWALNYLAFSHFIHWPEDTLRDFGRKTVGQVFENEDEGEEFVEFVARWDARTLSQTQINDIRSRTYEYFRLMSRGTHLEKWRFWNWLQAMAEGRVEPHTVSWF